MNRIDSYLADLWYDLFDRDVERMLAGQEPHNTDLLPLLPFVADVLTMGQAVIPEQFISDHVAVATATISVADRGAADPRHQLRRLSVGLKRRVAAGLAGMAMFGSLTGVAVASDAAIPGDWNYSIDRALETLGIGAGGAEERLQELMAMNEEGRSPGEVLIMTSELIEGEDQSAAALALSNAADRVAVNGGGGENSEAVHQNVSELLRYLSENTGKVDGQSVAEMAQEIGNPGQGNGPPETNPGHGNGPPASNPGNGNGPPASNPGKGNTKP